LVSLSVKTPEFYCAFNVARLAKRLLPKVCTMVGGPHVSALPQQALSCEAIDFAVPGEGEIAMRNLAEALERGTEVEAAKKHDLVFSGQVMIGFPSETEKEIEETVAFMRELDPVSVMLSVAAPLPATDL